LQPPVPVPNPARAARDLCSTAAAQSRVVWCSPVPNAIPGTSRIGARPSPAPVPSTGTTTKPAPRGIGNSEACQRSTQRPSATGSTASPDVVAPNPWASSTWAARSRQTSASSDGPR
jgi:hypothetical protein